MHDFQVPVLMPCPIKPSSLPRWQTLVVLVDPFMPASSLRQFHDPLLDILTLALLCLGQFGPILGPKGRGFEEPVAADDAADLLQRMRDLIHETFGPAALDEAGDFPLEAVVEGECVDDGGFAARARGCLAEEDQVGWMRWRDGVFIVPADEVAWWAPVLLIRDLRSRSCLRSDQFGGIGRIYSFVVSTFLA